MCVCVCVCVWSVQHNSSDVMGVVSCRCDFFKKKKKRKKRKKIFSESTCLVELSSGVLLRGEWIYQLMVLYKASVFKSLVRIFNPPVWWWRPAGSSYKMRWTCAPKKPNPTSWHQPASSFCFSFFSFFKNAFIVESLARLQSLFWLIWNVLLYSSVFNKKHFSFKKDYFQLI